MDIRISSFTHDGRGYVNSSPVELIAQGVPEAVVLNAVKPILKGLVDAAAETARLSLITGGVGQVMEYLETQAQAVAALASTTEPKADDYPMLAASLGIDIDPDTGKIAKTIKGVARAVLAAKSQWGMAGAAIRKGRLTTKAAIEAAATFEAAAAAVAGSPWPG